MGRGTALRDRSYGAVAQSNTSRVSFGCAAAVRIARTIYGTFGLRLRGASHPGNRTTPRTDILPKLARTHYRQPMEGVLTFPYIEVPSSAWFTRTLLYWDQVGTIVPRGYVDDPSLLSNYARELVVSELVRQVEPWDARFDSLRTDFASYLRTLSPEELSGRREALLLNESVRIHRDKFLMIGADVDSMFALGLVGGPALGDHGYFITMERRTASEFMAALVLVLCEPGQAWQADREGHLLRWVPTTDVPRAAEALVNGLSQDPGGEPLHLRIHGHQQTDQVRLEFLQRLLPVPTDPVPVERIVRFRERYGDLLPQLRRQLEREVDAAAGIQDPTMRQRHLDRIGDELEERVEQARRYLRETLQRRIVNSPLLRWAKFIPGIGKGAEAAREIAETGVTQGNFRVEPLAYLAFANAEFGPQPRVPPRIDPKTGYPVGYMPAEASE
jgi:hypothetical protein